MNSISRQSDESGMAAARLFTKRLNSRGREHATLSNTRVHPWMGDVGTSPNLGKSATEEVCDGAIPPVTPTWKRRTKVAYPTRVESLQDVHKRTESVCLLAEAKGIDEVVNHSVNAPLTTLSFIETLRNAAQCVQMRRSKILKDTRC